MSETSNRERVLKILDRRLLTPDEKKTVGSFIDNLEAKAALADVMAESVRYEQAVLGKASLPQPPQLSPMGRAAFDDRWLKDYDVLTPRRQTNEG